jgi:hypothetical protein
MPHLFDSGGAQGVSRVLRRLAVMMVLAPALPQTASAETPPAATDTTSPQALPNITVESPRRSAQAHREARRHARQAAQTSKKRTAANPSAAQPATPPSGAPNVASGAAGPPNMASQLTLTGEQLNARPVTRPGEILEAVPGLIVTQHSGEGKANQYFLRGYNLDHGTDMAIWVDDVPINLRTHAHGQGYSDLNWLMPETSTRSMFARGRITPMKAISAPPATCTSA